MHNPLWIVVADATQAHVYERTTPIHRLIEIVHLKQPAYDEAGHFGHAGYGVAPTSDTPETPHALPDQIAERLRDARIANRYGRVEVFARADLLDALLSTLQASGCKEVAGAHAVDLSDLPPAEMQRWLDARLKH